MRRATALLVLAAALAPSGGCVVAALAVGAAAAIGTIKYTENEAYEDFRASLDDTWQATVSAMQENGYPVSNAARPGANEGMIDISDAVVHVERVPGDLTRVRVRIGTFSTDDHRRRASLILEAVGKRID